MSAKEVLKEEILKKAVVHGKVILSSGKEADYYVDLRRVTLDATAAPLVGEVMLELTKDLSFEAVGGLTLEQAIACPSYGAPLVVIGAPLAIDADSFSQGAGNVEEVLRKICDAVHGFGDVKVKGEK